MRFFQYISIFACIGLIGFYVYQNSPHYHIIKGDIFGTNYNIKIKTKIKNKELKDLIKQKLEAINSTMSVFKEDSEISKINQNRTNSKITLSDDMSVVLKAADKVYRQSSGWFDPTLEPLIELWGFGKNKELKNPNDKKVSQTLKNVGFNKLKFSSNYKRLNKTNKNVKLNLSAIAKGYAVDQIAKLLENQGYNDYLVEIGGEIRTKGARSDTEDAWSIGINRPIADNHDNIVVLSLSNMAVATSGNYRNFYEKDGKTYAHTISYKTGKPIINDTLSVSVFHDSCMYADAYATAILAMGSKKGLDFANKHKLKVVIFDENFNLLTSNEAKHIFKD